MADAYRIIVLPRADADLAAVADYVRENASPDQAAAVAGRLEAAINTLTYLPERFQRVGVSRAHGTPVHLLVVRPYLIYYKVEHAAAIVHILTVRHGARRRLRRFE